MTNLTDRPHQNEPLHRIFTAVPPHYDMINHIITCGLDKRWRQWAAEECLASNPERMLDLCCGTGDFTISVAQLAGDNLAVFGVDYSQPMLKIAARKAESRDTKKISFVNSNAAHLPFPDGYFDCIGISFAFRNLTYRNPLTGKCLDEALRVLKTGGRFVIIETSQPESKLISKFYHLYLRWFVFRMGFILSGNRRAYGYLAKSATRFYNSQEVRKLLTTAGFRQVSFKPLFLGVVGIHIAIKQSRD